MFDRSPIPCDLQTEPGLPSRAETGITIVGVFISELAVTAH